MIRLVSDQSMSPLCGFGMTSFCPARHMTGCLPPPSGGPQPNARKRRTSSRHLIGLGRLREIQIQAANHRQRIPVAQSHDNP